MPERQKYHPVANRDIDEAASRGSHHRSTGPRPQRLAQGQDTETPRLRSPLKYEKGRKNKTRS
jgi:hypothetical protein